jgi:hypothetical protein
MSEALMVYPIGANVRIGPVGARTIAGVITAIFIRTQRVSYEVSYWNGLTYQQVTLDEFEFEAEAKEGKQPLGFRS